MSEESQEHDMEIRYAIIDKQGMGNHLELQSYPHHDVAYTQLRMMIAQHYQILKIEDLNKGRHRMFLTEEMNFYCVFKKAFFMSFSKQFEYFANEFPEHSSIGESLNEEWIRKALYHRCKIIFVYPDKKLYEIDAQEFWNFANTHNLKRLQDKDNFYNKGDGTGKKAPKNEITFSIPVSKLRRCYL